VVEKKTLDLLLAGEGKVSPKVLKELSDAKA
jgi:hypothetical protein